MTPAAQRSFEARMAHLAEATAFVEDFCRQQGIGHADALRLTFVVEELFTNTVEHGHGGDSDAPVRLELGASATEVTLLYEDAAAPFDVRSRLVDHALPEPDLPLEAQPQGGRGLGIVGRFAASARYAREDERNRLWLVLRRELQA